MVTGLVTTSLCIAPKQPRPTPTATRPARLYCSTLLAGLRPTPQRSSRAPSECLELPATSALAEALLDFSGPADLTAWLAAHA